MADSKLVDVFELRNTGDWEEVYLFKVDLEAYANVKQLREDVLKTFLMSYQGPPTSFHVHFRAAPRRPGYNVLPTTFEEFKRLLHSIIVVN